MVATMSPAGAQRQPAIALRDLVVLLDAFPALAGMTGDLWPGEVTVVQGPNGAGKSTLLRACAGLVAAASGRIVVLGLDPVLERRELRRRLAWVGHSAGLYNDLTVRENVRFTVRAAGLCDPDGRVDQALATVGLTGRLAAGRASALSAGQRRRVALANALARGASLWLLDEPHAALDSEARDVVDHAVHAATAAGATVLLASHDHDRALPLADRVISIAGGRIVADERVREVVHVA